MSVYSVLNSALYSDSKELLSLNNLRNTVSLWFLFTVTLVVSVFIGVSPFHRKMAGAPTYRRKTPADVKLGNRRMFFRLKIGN